MDSLPLHLGARIKAIRKSRGLSQERLAERAEIDSKFLSQLELGTRNPSLGTVHKIAHGLRVQLKDLFEFGHHSQEIKAELLRLVASMNDETARKAYRILKVLTE